MWHPRRRGHAMRTGITEDEGLLEKAKGKGSRQVHHQAQRFNAINILGSSWDGEAWLVQGDSKLVFACLSELNAGLEIPFSTEVDAMLNSWVRSVG